jgi:hypothetical protein
VLASGHASKVAKLAWEWPQGCAEQSPAAFDGLRRGMMVPDPLTTDQEFANETFAHVRFTIRDFPFLFSPWKGTSGHWHNQYHGG